MPDVNVYQLLFAKFAEEARKGKDVQKAAAGNISALVDLWVNQLGPSGSAKFRGFSVSPSTQRAEDGAEQVLLCVRGFDLQGKKVISFANGPTFGLAAFSWLHNVTTGDINWKFDEDKRKTSGFNDLVDAIRSTGS